MGISKASRNQSVSGTATKAAKFKSIFETDENPSESENESSDSNTSKENDEPSDGEPSDNDESDDESSDNNSSNNEKMNKKRKQIRKLVKTSFINPKHELRTTQKVIESSTGILINKPSSHPLNAHRVWWEYMRSMKHKKRLKRFLVREGWKLHPSLDVMTTTANTNTIPLAPLKFEIFWTPIYIRILKKLADKEKHTTEARCHALYIMMKCLDWYHMKRAMGRNDNLVQEAILEALETQEKATIFAHYRALLEVDTENEDLGKANFNNARFDRSSARSYENELGCIAPDRYKVIKTAKDKQLNKSLTDGVSGKKKSKPKGKAKAPELDDYFNEKYHVPKNQEGGTAYCKYYDTDSCSKKSSCRFVHRCKYCAGLHPGSKCDRK